MRLSMPAAADIWVCDARGDGVLVSASVTSELGQQQEVDTAHHRVEWNRDPIRSRPGEATPLQLVEHHVKQPGIAAETHTRHGQPSESASGLNVVEGPRRNELAVVLTRHWKRLGLTLDLTDFTDAQAVAAVGRITRGNFRLVHRLFVQIERVMRINKLTVITSDVVEAARGTLVIGDT
jgi:hypothetical protein